jgi:lysophospholipid acyltransferase (LPLAT)-like uncharacterized protein
MRIRLFADAFPAVLGTTIECYARTLHYHLFGTEHLRAAGRASPYHAFLVAHWHQSMLAIVGPHHHLKVATLASRSHDGDVSARYLERIGLRVVRGSSSRGGAEGAKALMRSLQEGYHLVINVDGPRGPSKVVKPGVPELARRCGIPVVPLVARATREWSLKRSWDRFRIPIPGSHVAVCYGEPIFFTGPEPDAAELVRRRQLLGRRLHALEAYACSLTGRSDPYPPMAELAWLTAGSDTGNEQ